MHFRPDPSHSAGLRLVRLDYESVRPGLSAYRHFPPAGGRQPGAAVGLRQRAGASGGAAATGGPGGHGRPAQPSALRPAAAVEGGEAGAARAGGWVRCRPRVLTGTEEALYGWLAVNFLMNSLGRHGNTYGLLDMGGGQRRSFSSRNGRPCPMSLWRIFGRWGEECSCCISIATRLWACPSFGAITVVVQGDSQVDDAERYDLCSQQRTSTGCRLPGCT
uniref:DAGKa domain-containing protein n=1 Tax=Macrostomum lignano TaxID=282301 RepID=A0A1I8FH34_9PLAT